MCFDSRAARVVVAKSRRMARSVKGFFMRVMVTGAEDARQVAPRKKAVALCAIPHPLQKRKGWATRHPYPARGLVADVVEVEDDAACDEAINSEQVPASAFEP